MTAGKPSLLELLDYGNRNAVVSSQDVQTTSLAAGAKSRRKNGRDLRLDHLPRRRVASAISRFHDEAYAFRSADSASVWIFAFSRHAGFGVRHALSPEWASQCGGLCLRHIDRSPIRRADHGDLVVFWGAARSARALICHRRFRK